MCSCKIDATETLVDVQQRLGNDIHSKAIICRWVVHYNRGDMNLEDEAHSEPPKSVTIAETAEEIMNALLRDRKRKVEKIVKTVCMSNDYTPHFAYLIKHV